METDDFLKEFHERVLATAATDGNFSRGAFGETALGLLEEAGQITEFTPCFFKGSGYQRRALELDAYTFDEVDDSLAVFIVDYHNFAATERLTRSDASRLFAKLTAFLDEALSGRLTASIEDSHAAFAIALELKQQRTQLTRIRLFLITDALMSEQIKALPGYHVNSTSGIWLGFIARWSPRRAGTSLRLTSAKWFLEVFRVLLPV